MSVTRRIAFAFALALAMTLANACSRPSADSDLFVSDTTSSAPAVAYEAPVAAPQPSPLQHAGAQVGRSDALLNASAPALGEWVAMWRATLPGFQADSLWSTGRKRWRPLQTRRWEGVEPLREMAQDRTFDLLGVPSPDSFHTLHVDTYQYIAYMGNKLEVGGEPDSKPSLIDHRTGLEGVLRQCGTTCGFHWGTWLSPTRFALGGWSDADDHGRWKHGTLWIYSLADSTVTGYATRIVSSGDYERYLGAWKDWLLLRYRAWEARQHS